jgi:alkylhydroperoxidase family enzyme
MTPAEPRIKPGGRAEIGTINFVFSRIAGRVTKTGPPNIFTTLGKNPRLLRRWLFFAGGLMPGGKLPRVDTELVILRVAANAGSDYEWNQHVAMGRRAGLSADDIERIRIGPGAAGWSERQLALLSACDDMHSEREVSDATWGRLTELLDEPLLIELCMLIAHYEMLAMVLASLRVQPEH